MSWPVFWRTTSHSVGFSLAWVWMRTPCSRASRATSRSSPSRAGEDEARREGVAQPAVLLAVPALAAARGSRARRGLGGLAQPRGQPLPRVHHRLAAHQPEARVARRTRRRRRSGAPCPCRARRWRRSGSAPRRSRSAEARMECSSCAASKGQMRSRSQSSSSSPSARLRNSVWQACRWPWMRPGSTTCPRTSSTRGAPRAAQAAPHPRDAAVLHEHVRVREHLALAVHGDDGAVGEEQVHRRARLRAALEEARR